jgi:Protein of unknown function (DUF1688)
MSSGRTTVNSNDASLISSTEPLPPVPDPRLDAVGYLRSLVAVRQRCAVVMGKARRNELRHFEVDEGKFENTVKWVVGIIKVRCAMETKKGWGADLLGQRDYAPDYSKIPPHGRWQHFDVGGRPRVDQLLDSWPSSLVDAQERARRLIDLFVVSVLLDAGAGTEWQYKSKENGKMYSRSEGLAIASIEMFKSGAFSGSQVEPCQVDAAGLTALNEKVMAKGLQVGPNNPIEGLEGRTGLLIRLGDALRANREIFGETQRPGNMLGMFHD